MILITEKCTLYNTTWLIPGMQYSSVLLLGNAAVLEIVLILYVFMFRLCIHACLHMIHIYVRVELKNIFMKLFNHFMKIKYNLEITLSSPYHYTLFAFGFIP